MNTAIVTEELSEEPLAWLGERCRVVRAFPGDPAFEAHAETCTALIVRTYTRVNTDLLDRMPALRVVARAGVALDNIDVAACRKRNIEVVHAPGANSSAVAEYVFALLFDALRPRVFLDAPLGTPEWEAARKDLIASRQLADCRLGIWGFGRVGRLVARAAAGFGVETIYNDLLDVPESERSGATPVGRDELLESADIVTVHVDDRPANRGLVSTEAFGRMKPDVVFLNCARGLIVDPRAAAAFFWANRRALGLFDVHDPEPFGADYPLLGLPNVHLAPHIAAATERAKVSMSWVVRDVVRVLAGEAPENPAPATSEA